MHLFLAGSITSLADTTPYLWTAPSRAWASSTQQGRGPRTPQHSSHINKNFWVQRLDKHFFHNPGSTSAALGELRFLGAAPEVNLILLLRLPLESPDLFLFMQTPNTCFWILSQHKLAQVIFHLFNCNFCLRYLHRKPFISLRAFRFFTLVNKDEIHRIQRDPSSWAPSTLVEMILG